MILYVNNVEEINFGTPQIDVTNLEAMSWGWCGRVGFVCINTIIGTNGYMLTL